MKKRKWKFRIAGGAVTLLGIYLMAVGYGEMITLTIATVVLIFGIAIWSMATPESYNSMTDMIAMISMEKPRKIEEFYEAYKNVDTPFGSAWLAKFYTMRQKALVFGPDAKGEYLYFWLTKDGHVGYLGYSFIEGFIKKKLTTPVYPIHEDVAENLADHLSYHSDLMMFQSELKANLEQFLRHTEDFGVHRIVDIKCIQRHGAVDLVNQVSFCILQIEMLARQAVILRESVNLGR